MVPGHHESAGKRLSGKTRNPTPHAVGVHAALRAAAQGKGSQWLRVGLIQAAQAAARQKNSYLAAQFHRLAAKRGHKRAIMALAHSILVIAYHIIQRRQPYAELGGNYFDERKKATVANRLTRRLERLGYTVSISTPTSSSVAV